MNEPSSAEFILRGQLNGVEITPRTIGLSQFNEYNQQVETFISGSERVKLDDVHVEILDGSYVFRVLSSAMWMVAGLETDLRLLERQDVLGELDPKRAEIIQRWQRRAKADPLTSYEIRPYGKELPHVKVTRDTDYRLGEVVPWVATEKYLFGQIVDMGGADKANVHLKLKVDPKPVIAIIRASQDYLREQSENRLYHKALLHVRAEQHFRTGELRNIRLIAFVDYEPRYSDEALDRFAAIGAEAWADVPDAARWVRELRGD